MSDLATRQELLAAAERHEEELEVALKDLEHAVRRPFEVGAQFRRSISQHPLPWLTAGLLVGVYLGSRGR